MSISRADHVITPGKLIFDPAGTPVACYSSTGWKTEIMETLVNLQSSRDGTFDQVITGRLVKITGKPTQFTAAALGKLYTITGKRIGASIVGSTDNVIELHTVDDKKRTLACGFVYQEPAMTCMAGKTILGDVVIYGIVPLDRGTDMDDIYDEGSTTWDDEDWDPDAEITPGWNVSWTGGSASKWDDMDVEDGGMTITPRASLRDVTSARDGLVNVMLTDYGVDISGKVMNISETLVLDALGRTLKMGERKSSLGRTMKFDANTENAFIRCFNAVLQPTTLNYDAQSFVVSDLSWKTFPQRVDGLRTAHFTVGTSNPDV